MKTLTIRLPDRILAEIEQESRVRRVPKSDVVRERLKMPASPLSKESSLRSILETAWSADVPDQPQQFRSPKKQLLARLIRAKKLHR